MPTEPSLNPYDLLLEGKFKQTTSTDGSASFVCSRCDHQARISTVYFSWHSAELEGICSGMGGVSILEVPYCTSCGDPMPGERGCIHAYVYGDGGIVSVNTQPNMIA